MPASSQPSKNHCTDLDHLAELGAALHANDSENVIWLALEKALSEFFGYSLFTVLAFSEPLSGRGFVTRLYSTNTDLHPLGTRRKRPIADQDNESVGNPPCRAAWVQQVLMYGNIWRGSVREDLKAAFEDWERLWQAGLGSVMNIPVRLNGVTIGSLNILDEEHKYDAADLELGMLLAQIVACFIHGVADKTMNRKLAD